MHLRNDKTPDNSPGLLIAPLFGDGGRDIVETIT